jgi:N-acetylneuraminic acid mutarotase
MAELLSVNDREERRTLVVEGGSIVYQRDTQDVWISLAAAEPTMAPTMTRLTDMPEAKEQHGFEECGGLLYAACGITTGTVHSKTLYAYDPITDSWSRKADAPIAVQSPVLRAVEGRLYLIGGYDSYIPLKYNTCYAYDPGTDSWNRKADMPTAREDMASAVVGGKIYVFGGLTNPGHVFVLSIDVYDAHTDSWTTRTWSTPRALGDFGASYSGKVYLVGGTGDMSQYPDDLSVDGTVLVYDPADNTWERKADVPIPGCYREIEELCGKLYAVSGVTVNTTTYTGAVLMYDPVGDSWSTLPLVACAARGVAMTKYGGSLFYAGGYNGEFLSSMYKITV